MAVRRRRDNNIIKNKRKKKEEEEEDNIFFLILLLLYNNKKKNRTSRPDEIKILFTSCFHYSLNSTYVQKKLIRQKVIAITLPSRTYRFG